MSKIKSTPIFLLIFVLLLILLTACSEATPEPTPLPPAEETPEVESPELDLTVPADDEVSGEEGSQDEGSQEEGPQEEGVEPEASLTPPASGLTAVIVSGDTAGAGKPFTFDATQSEADEVSIVQYIWNMGDGTTLFGLSVEHAYSDPGFYTVTLIVTDESGQTDTAAKVVEIFDLEATPTPPAESDFAVVGTTWKLDNAIRGTAVTLAFEEERVSGSAGCNDYNAIITYTSVEETITHISVSRINTSNDTCTPEIMAQERGYLDSLASAESATVEGTRLSLKTGSGTLIFTKVAE